MSQTFVITTPDTVDTSKRVFPQAGVVNLKVIKNGDYRKTGIWINGTTVIASHPLKIVGGKFTGFVSSGVTQNVVPSSVPVIDATTVTLANSVFNYLEVTIDEGKPFAYITTDYFVGDVCIAGGTEDTEALIDYSVRPYFIASFNGMFTNRKIRYDLTNWNTNPVLNMNLLFANNTKFNQDIGNWDVSNCTSFRQVFSGAVAFNKSLSKWNMSKAVSLYAMFAGATAFNQDIGAWNVSNVTDFSSLFNNATLFNKNIGSWDLAKATTLANTFYGAWAFNQDIGAWNVSNVTDFTSLFRDAKSFNKSLANWNMIKATTISGIFRGASVFDQELNSWNLSNCTSFASAFRDSIFNKSLSNWNVSKGTEFGGMFWNNTKFNQSLSNWDVSSAVNMTLMFAQATAFNQNISNWNIAKVTDMSSMFGIATAFNQDLSAWCAKFNINVNLANFLDNSGMSAANYSAFLNALWTDIGTTRQGAWVARTTAKILGAANLKYNSTATAARASLIANGWTITDGGLAA